MSSKAEDIIEARFRGASLGDIYSSLRSGISLDGVEHRESLRAVKDLLDTNVKEIAEALENRSYESLHESAKSLHEVASMLENACSEISGGKNGADGNDTGS